MRINISDDYASEMDRAIQAKREAEREYGRSVEKLASDIAENLNDLPFGMDVYLDQDPVISSDIAHAIASHSRDRVRDLEVLRDSIAEISSDVAGEEDRKLALRVIDKHIKLHGG